MKTVKILQKFLIQAGAKLPKYGIDGDLGKETISAIESLDFPNFIKTALKEVGTHEIKGIKNNPKVIEYHSATGGYSNDEVPWCGSFISWCLKQNNIPRVKIGERALSWLNFGISSTPMLGAIAVKTRKGGGHVCFVLGRNKEGDLYCLGGNQNDEVNISLYKKEVFTDFRILKDYSYTLPIFDLESQKADKES